MCAASLGRVQERCRRLPFALGGETETVAQARTHRGGRCGRGRSVVEEGEVEAIVRVVSKRVEDVGVEPVLKHRAAEWVR